MKTKTWTIDVKPSMSRVGWWKVIARKGDLIMIKDRLTFEEVERFDPDKEWSKR